jgi:serine/threonine protein kinase
MVSYQTVQTPIEFGKTKLEDYQAIAPLGKGTYGEVNKCIHNQTNYIVAIKTFLFEVSFSKSF